jgi:hypothetical protein
MSYDQRLDEITEAVEEAQIIDIPYVPVIPIRMSEAWFLHDASAIRLAAGNPNGSMSLSIPSVNQVQKLADPKKTLEDLLVTATGNNKRRRKKFKPRKEIHRVAELIEDFSALRADSSFLKLEASLEALRFTVFI